MVSFVVPLYISKATLLTPLVVTSSSERLTVKVSRFDLSIEEAIEEMDSLNYRVYMFLNSSTEKINVL